MAGIVMQQQHRGGINGGVAWRGAAVSYAAQSENGVNVAARRHQACSGNGEAKNKQIMAASAKSMCKAASAIKAARNWQ